jgi:hypothetical protein
MWGTHYWPTIGSTHAGLSHTSLSRTDGVAAVTSCSSEVPCIKIQVYQQFSLTIEYSCLWFGKLTHTTVNFLKPRFRARTDRTTANPGTKRLRNGSACSEFMKRGALVAGLGARVQLLWWVSGIVFWPDASTPGTGLSTPDGDAAFFGSCTNAAGITMPSGNNSA